MKISSTAPPQSEREFWGWFTVFAILLGSFVTLWGYRFGVTNHLSNLPLLYRKLDPTYLPGDFYVNAAAGFGLRFYYVETLAFLARFISIPVLYLILTLLINAVFAWLTGRVAWELSDRSRRAAVLAAVFVFSVSSFNLGTGGTFGAKMLLPFDLAFVFVLAAVWLLLRRNPVLAALFLGLGSVIHAHLILFGTVILLAAFLAEYPPVERVLGRMFAWRGFAAGRGGKLKQGGELQLRWVTWVGAGLIWVGLGALTVVPQFMAPGIPDDQFLAIYLFRNPHHILPSWFPLGTWLKFFLFLPLMGYAWWVWAQGLSSQAGAPPQKTRYPARFILIFSVFVLLLLIGGYVFVELFPLKIWALAQVYRLSVLLRWFGLILFAIWIDSRWAAAQENRPFWGPTLALIALLSPLSFAVFLGFDPVRKTLARTLPGLEEWRWVGALKLLGVGLGIVLDLEIVGVFFYLVLMVWGILLLESFGRRRLRLAWAGVGLFLIGMSLWGYALFPDSPAWRAAFSRPIISLSQRQTPEIQIAQAIQVSLPRDALLLTPPNGEVFRLYAERAVVIDFKSMPVPENRMPEWYARLERVYGPFTQLGFEALPEMESNYRALTDDDLRDLQGEYGFDYAVLYRGMETSFPIVTESETYRVVQLAP